jgi:hypothetical protein
MVQCAFGSWKSDRLYNRLWCPIYISGADESSVGRPDALLVSNAADETTPYHAKQIAEPSIR